MQSTDRLKILDRLANGQISAAEALALLEQAGEAIPPAETASESKTDSPKMEGLDEIDLLKAMEAGSTDPKTLKIDVDEIPAPIQTPKPFDEAVTYPGNGKKPRWLRIRVRDLETGRNKVSVNLPLGIVTFGLGIARRFNPEMGDLDLDEMMTLIKQGERGLLVDVEDDDDNEHVQIYVD